MVYSANETDQNQFDRLGFPGRYHSAVAVATTVTQSFSGSMYGYGAFMLGNGADNAATKIFVAGGGVIAGPDLSTETIYDISPLQVQSTGGTIFVLKRQQ
tara:strand:+ start:3006 stop:3305 length:300 start_codon:yes stop_codon:yes gene_type:complete